MLGSSPEAGALAVQITIAVDAPERGTEFARSPDPKVVLDHAGIRYLLATMPDRSVGFFIASRPYSLSKRT